MKEGPPFLPAEIANLTKECLQCGEHVSPLLWKRGDEPFVPIYPTGTYGEAGMWQQASSTVRCACGATVEFSLNSTRLKGTLLFFGDEVERQLRDFDWLGYTFIGGSREYVSQITRDFNSIKVKYIDDRSPDSWRVHAAALVDSSKRMQHAVYRKIPSTKVPKFLEECAQVLCKSDKLSWSAHCCGAIKKNTDKRKRAKDLKSARALVHLAIVSFLIYEATKNEFRPKFIMDATRPVEKYPHIESWSRETYLGSTTYLANAFLSHGNEIEPPEFWRPGSHPLLELADVHAFYAARHAHNLSTGRSPEFDLRQFGRLHYIALNGVNKFEHLGYFGIPTSIVPKS